MTIHCDLINNILKTFLLYTNFFYYLQTITNYIHVGFFKKGNFRKGNLLKTRNFLKNKEILKTKEF